MDIIAQNGWYVIWKFLFCGIILFGVKNGVWDGAEYKSYSSLLVVGLSVIELITAIVEY